MAATLPVQALPFDPAAQCGATELPNGFPFSGTNQEYFDAVMALQYDCATKVAPLVAIEVECRKALDGLLYPNGYPTNNNRQDGTDKFELPSGWVMEFQRRINVKIDEAQLPSIKEEVSKLPVDEETGEMPTFGSALKFKPDLSMSGYGNLRDDVRVLLNQALTFTPGTPGVKVIPPKAKAAAKAADQKAKAAS